MLFNRFLGHRLFNLRGIRLAENGPLIGKLECEWSFELNSARMSVDSGVREDFCRSHTKGQMLTTGGGK